MQGSTNFAIFDILFIWGLKGEKRHFFCSRGLKMVENIENWKIPYESFIECWYFDQILGQINELGQVFSIVQK